MAAAVEGAIGGRNQVPGTHGRHHMFEFLRFELVVHHSAVGWLSGAVTRIITVIIDDVRALCTRCARAVRALCKNAPFVKSPSILRHSAQRTSSSPSHPVEVCSSPNGPVRSSPAQAQRSTPQKVHSILRILGFFRRHQSFDATKI